MASAPGNEGLHLALSESCSEGSSETISEQGLGGGSSSPVPHPTLGAEHPFAPRGAGLSWLRGTWGRSWCVPGSLSPLAMSPLSAFPLECRRDGGAEGRGRGSPGWESITQHWHWASLRSHTCLALAGAAAQPRQPGNAKRPGQTWEGGAKVSCHPHCHPRVWSVPVTTGYMGPQPPHIPQSPTRAGNWGGHSTQGRLQCPRGDCAVQGYPWWPRSGSSVPKVAMVSQCWLWWPPPAHSGLC